MPTNHSQLANFIWSICNLLRGPYKRNEYRKVILPMTVLRRFDCLLAPTKAQALEEFKAIKAKPENIIRHKLQQVTSRPFYNLSRLDLPKLLNDPNQLAPNLNSYINAFSPNVRAIMERFSFDQQIARMAEKNLLYEVIKAFCRVDLSPPLKDGDPGVDNVQMGYVFEELIRIGAEQSNEEAGEHFTPREVIKLMVNLLLSPEKDLRRSHVVKTIYDPACGTGGMLSVSEQYIRRLNTEANPLLFGQDWNDEAWAVCKSDMLIKGEDADNIILGDTFTQDGFKTGRDGKPFAFDYMLANPPFGVEWKQQQRYIEQERDSLGYQGRFGAGTPRVNDGALLFLQHMLSKMRAPKDGGSRLTIVFNGSPLFTGDAGGGESEIRRWIIENDWLEAIVALPEQLFYNTGISTYLWVLTNRKDSSVGGGPSRKGKVQLIDARAFWVQMEKSLGNKRRRIGDPSDKEKDPDHIGELTRIFGNFRDGETRIFTEEDPTVREQEIEAGQQRQEEIRAFLRTLGSRLCKEREAFHSYLRKSASSAVKPLRLSPAELKAVLAALGERDETAEICRDRDSNPEPDADLRDTETVPLKESIEEYFKREVLPHVPDAWIDETKTKVGYEIPLNRHFYRYEPPRPLEVIETDIKRLEEDIMKMLKEVTA